MALRPARHKSYQDLRHKVAAEHIVDNLKYQRCIAEDGRIVVVRVNADPNCIQYDHEHCTIHEKRVACYPLETTRFIVQILKIVGRLEQHASTKLG